MPACNGTTTPVPGNMHRCYHYPRERKTPRALVLGARSACSATQANSWRRFYNADSPKTLSKPQHGFRRNRSTESALLALAEDTLQAFNRRKQILAIGLDISKAFDSVSHPHILSRLRELEVPQYITVFLSSFLSGRRATLTPDDTPSSVMVS